MSDYSGIKFNKEEITRVPESAKKEEGGRTD
jgi:hypothetical protein